MSQAKAGKNTGISKDGGWKKRRKRGGIKNGTLGKTPFRKTRTWQPSADKKWGVRGCKLPRETPPATQKKNDPGSWGRGGLTKNISIGGVRHPSTRGWQNEKKSNPKKKKKTKKNVTLERHRASTKNAGGKKKLTKRESRN